ncbi:MAG TPA: DNA repair protein RecN, partial [Hellea balneolensis]|nr:DNA repair protein RecN [Hellea balneolensis]
MLSEISVRDVVLIDKLDLELGKNFNVMTGETGAGKSIVLDALGMATGARSDKGLLRKNAQKAQCTAVFTLQSEHPVWAELEGAGVDAEAGDDLVLRRTLAIDGRSRAYINDAPVSARLLARIGSLLLEVHGQHDGRGLLDIGTHRGYLDQYANLSDDLDTCRKCFAAQSVARAHLQDLLTRQQKAEDEKAYLEHAISELDRLAARIGEDEELARERKRLQMSEGALAELSSAQQALGGERQFETQLSQGLAGLERLQAKLDTDDRSSAAMALGNAITAIEKALLELDEAANAVNQAAECFIFEPGRLDTVEERLFSLRATA